MAELQKAKDSFDWWEPWQAPKEILTIADIDFIEDHYSKEIYSIEEILQRLTPVFQKHGVRIAILFGSYARGCPTYKSDVDLVVDCDLHGWNFYGLVDEVERALDKDVDVYDISDIIPDSRVDREIRRTGVKFYEK